MKNNQPQPAFDPSRLLKKFFLSAFVVFSFIAYALHKPFTSADGATGPVAQTPSALVSQQLMTSTPSASPDTTGIQPQAPAATVTTLADTAIPPAPAPTATVAKSSGLYKNGTFTGSEVDAFYGLVRVKTVIKNGKVVDVQFVEYPSDRRTSVRINTFAMPYLQQEAIQAQQANVDIVSGATLTSQAFAMSLQSALDQAKN